MQSFPHLSFKCHSLVFPTNVHTYTPPSLVPAPSSHPPVLYPSLSHIEVRTCIYILITYTHTFPPILPILIPPISSHFPLALSLSYSHCTSPSISPPWSCLHGSSSTAGEEWIKLPPVTPIHIVAARQIRKFFSGCLEAKVRSQCSGVPSYVPQ